MKLASVVLREKPQCVIVADEQPYLPGDEPAAWDITPATRVAVYPVPKISDVGEFVRLRASDPSAAQQLLTSALLRDSELVAAGEFLPVIPSPGKVVCCGMNYADHIAEMGRPRPEYPTLFAKFTDSLARPFADIPGRGIVAYDADYEGELAVIIGDHVPFGARLTAAQAQAAIAGFTVTNDISLRALQYRTSQWMQGKNAPGSSALGPWMTTSDAIDIAAQRLVTVVNGDTRQDTSISQLVFTATDLVAYCAHTMSLSPGDVIVTGTTGGVGWARDPRCMLAVGDVVRVAITGIGPVVSVIADT